MRATDIFSLDFTAPGSMEAPEKQNAIEEAFDRADDAIEPLRKLIDEGCQDTSAWRLLGSLYVGVGNINAYNVLDERHQKEFGYPIFQFLKLPRAPRDDKRKLFEMPPRLTRGALPDLDEVLAACHTEDGAAVDFSRVRGADSGGLEELAEMLDCLPRDEGRPEMPGMERFMTSLHQAAESPTGSQRMWRTIFAYLRFINDEPAFDELSLKFAVKYGISPPPFDLVTNR